LVLYANGALCYFLEKESRILTRKSWKVLGCVQIIT
jgi:hypothetical protein